MRRYQRANDFAIGVPDGWELDEGVDGSVVFWKPDGPGSLHIVAFDRDPEDEPDPAEELYGFLEDQEIELYEDEVEDVDLEPVGSLAYCEYEAEGDEGAEYCIVGVATTPGRLVFASYSCPAGSEVAEREEVIEMLRRLEPDPSVGGERERT